MFPTGQGSRYGALGIDVPTKMPRRATHRVYDVGLHVGVVILHVPSVLELDGCCRGHVVYGNLSFLYILYNDSAYNFDRHSVPYIVMATV